MLKFLFFIKFIVVIFKTFFMGRFGGFFIFLFIGRYLFFFIIYGIFIFIKSIRSEEELFLVSVLKGILGVGMKVSIILEGFVKVDEI